MEPALKTVYKERAVPALKEKFTYDNVHRIPAIQKVVLNVGFGKAEDRKAAAEAVIEDLGKITGQRAVVTKARTAISNFKLRVGDTIGARATIRDFRGLPTKSFDGRGNYTCGISDHTIFPEIELDKVTRTIGFDFTIVTSAESDKEARELLTLLGFPFRK